MNKLSGDTDAATPNIFRFGLVDVECDDEDVEEDDEDDDEDEEFSDVIKVLLFKLKFCTELLFPEELLWPLAATLPNNDDTDIDDDGIFGICVFEIIGGVLPTIILANNALFMSIDEFESSLLKLWAIWAAAICAFADFLLFSSLKQWFFWWRINS